MKITDKTKMVYFNMDNGRYEFHRWDQNRPGLMVVGTAKHFIHTVCKLFEDTYPSMEDNPMWQDVDWNQVETIKSKKEATFEAVKSDVKDSIKVNNEGIIEPKR